MLETRLQSHRKLVRVATGVEKSRNLKVIAGKKVGEIGNNWRNVFVPVV